LADAEKAIREFCEKHNIAWTILRPTLIYTEGRDRNISRLARLIDRYGILPLAGAGTGKRQPVHAEDLAIGALRAATSPAAQNRDYNLPGGETLTYREMCERIFEGLGRRPRIVSIPPKVWFVASKLVGPFMPGITPTMGSRMSEDLTFDPGQARRDFFWQSRDFRPIFKPNAFRGEAGYIHGDAGD
jgi:nucleoside-diphosphate-sugar epimerase